METMYRISPCPFCGMEGSQPFKERRGSRTVWSIRCPSYCVTMRRDELKEVLTDWNSRRFPLVGEAELKDLGDQLISFISAEGLAEAVEKDKIMWLEDSPHMVGWAVFRLMQGTLLYTD